LTAVNTSEQCGSEAAFHATFRSALADARTEEARMSIRPVKRLVKSFLEHGGRGK
jgi:hypothetical protein